MILRIAPEFGMWRRNRGLSAHRAVDTNRDQRASGHDQNQVNVGNLFASVEDGDEEEAGEGARERDSCDLGTDDGRSFRALVRIGQMPLASGTGGHQE